MRLSIILITAHFGLSACASFNIKPEPTAINPDLPTHTQSQWSEAGLNARFGGVLSNDWVTQFGSSKLSSLIDEALENNTNIGAALGRYEAGLARYDISRADRLPTVNGQAGISRTINTRAFNPNQGAFSGGINAMWEADVWRRIKDQIKSSKAQSLALGSDYAATRLSIAGQVTQAWFDLIEADRLVELSQRDVTTLQRASDLTQRRFEGGVVGSSDVRLARSSVANAQALQATRRQQLAATTRRLETLLRRYPANELEGALEFPSLPGLPDIGIPSDILERRPDIIAAYYRLETAGLNIDIARKNLLPQFSITSQLSDGAPSVAELFNIDSLVANIAGNISGPVFQGGRLKADIRQQEAEFRTELENYVDIVLQAYLEVENALNAETRLQEREQALERAVEEALKAEERLELRYTEGLATILQLLDAQTRRISAEGQLISAQKERLANRVRLHLALGGGDIGSLPTDTIRRASAKNIYGL